MYTNHDRLHFQNVRVWTTDNGLYVNLFANITETIPNMHVHIEVNISTNNDCYRKLFDIFSNTCDIYKQPKFSSFEVFYKQIVANGAEILRKCPISQVRKKYDQFFLTN